MRIKKEGSANDTIPYLSSGEELRLYLQPNTEIQKQPGMESATQVSRVAVIKGQGQWKFSNIIGWQVIQQQNFSLALFGILGILVVALTQYRNTERGYLRIR